jgi:uncharacterized membrane protein
MVDVRRVKRVGDPEPRAFDDREPRQPIVDSAPSVTPSVAATSLSTTGDRTPYLASGVVLGMGMGGLIDAIVFHHLLQWHHTVSAITPATTLSGARVNTFYDGVSYALLSLLVAAGLAMLVRAARRPDAVLTAPSFALSLGVGWGSFNLLEGLIAHHLLGIHHLRPGPDALDWDIGYLVVSALVAIGCAIAIRASQPRTLTAATYRGTPGRPVPAE